MRVTFAQLPPAESSDDRVFVTPHAVIVLDGASAFTPVPVSAATYADTLGRRLAQLLDEQPAAGLRAVLRDAIAHTATTLDLRPGRSPSSTVSILRERADEVDVLVLGDSPVVLGMPEPVVLTDDRLARLDLPERDAYRARLAAGAGLDDEHWALLAKLQQRQAHYRNQPDGYWIAETDPTAAEHAIVPDFPRHGVSWAVLATDGAAGSLARLSLVDWSTLAQLEPPALTDLLQQCHTWEAEIDPRARLAPRAKRHDDKALATVNFPEAAPARQYIIRGSS